VDRGAGGAERARLGYEETRAEGAEQSLVYLVNCHRNSSVAAGLFHGAARITAEKLAKRMLVVSAGYDIANSVTDYSDCRNG